MRNGSTLVVYNGKGKGRGGKANIVVGGLWELYLLCLLYFIYLFIVFLSFFYSRLFFCPFIPFPVLFVLLRHKIWYECFLSKRSQLIFMSFRCSAFLSLLLVLNVCVAFPLVSLS